MTDRLSDTPRVDAEARRFISSNEFVPADFARQLERELAEARRDAERYRWLRDPANDNVEVLVRKHLDDDFKSLWNKELDAAIDSARKDES